MLTDETHQDEKARKAIPQIARLLEDILQQVKDANAKLDYLIESYHDARYAPQEPRTPDWGYSQY